MDNTDIKLYFKELDDNSRKILLEELSEIDDNSSFNLLTIREEQLSNKQGSCPHCGSLKYSKDGHEKNGVQRFRCKSCKRCFTPYTGTWLAKINKKEKLVPYLKLMHAGKSIDKNYFKLILDNDQTTIYTAIVYSKGLKRNIKLVYEQPKGEKTKSYLLFFSTDIELDALEILQYYKNRFQIEFLYRDGKQHTGLNDCQARSENKLHFHFNASLTAINLAKVEHWLVIPKEERGAFSMSDVKTMYHNILLIERFIDVFAVPAYKLKNNNNVKELINFGKIAA